MTDDEHLELIKAIDKELGIPPLPENMVYIHHSKMMADLEAAGIKISPAIMETIGRLELHWQEELDKKEV